VQDANPIADENCPAKHWTQAVEFTDEVLTLNLPARQSMHFALALKAMYLPASHGVHPVTPAPVAAMYFPISHSLQVPRAVIPWYFPLGQLMQALWPPKENLPAAHASHDVLPVEAA